MKSAFRSALSKIIRLFRLKKIAIKTQNRLRIIQRGFDVKIANKSYDHLLRCIQTECPPVQLKVYFIVTQKQLWNSTVLYQIFKNSKQFDPAIIVFPNTEDNASSPSQTLSDNKLFFLSNGFNVITGVDAEQNPIKISSLIQKPAIVFIDQPHFNIGLGWGLINIARRAMICYIPYGFKIANNNIGHFGQEIHDLSWKVFVETEWHKSMFVKIGGVKGRNTVVTGYPKFDLYLSTEMLGVSENTQSLLTKAAGRKIVIWAPHWSIHDGLLNYSTFDKYFQDFKKLAETLDNVFFVFKPHQRLKYYVQEVGLMSKVKVEKYFNFWEKSKNSIIFNDPDYIHLFKESSALITDSGSFLAEYLPSKNPILLLKSNDSQGYNEIGNLLIQNYYQAENFKTVESFIKDVVVNSVDQMKLQRLEVLDQIWESKNQNSSERIYSHIVKSINQKI